MMMGGVMPGGGMMGGQVPNNMMMGGANMYNMGGANMYNMQQAQMHQLQQVIKCLWPCRVGSVGSVSASRTVGREFASRPGHTKDHHKNGTDCLPA